jgi:hypothetical protein
MDDVLKRPPAEPPVVVVPDVARNPRPPPYTVAETDVPESVVLPPALPTVFWLPRIFAPPEPIVIVYVAPDVMVTVPCPRPPAPPPVPGAAVAPVPPKPDPPPATMRISVVIVVGGINVPLVRYLTNVYVFVTNSSRLVPVNVPGIFTVFAPIVQLFVELVYTNMRLKLGISLNVTVVTPLFTSVYVAPDAFAIENEYVDDEPQ